MKSIDRGDKTLTNYSAILLYLGCPSMGSESSNLTSIEGEEGYGMGKSIRAAVAEEADQK